MAFTQAGRLTDELFDRSPVNGEIKNIGSPILRAFDRLVISHFIFTFVLAVCALMEFFFLIIFFPSLLQSSLFSFSIAGFFMTLFACLMLKQFLNAQRPEKIFGLCLQFIEQTKIEMRYQEGEIDHHIALAQACCKFADLLHGREFYFYSPPKWMSFLAPFLEKFSCYWHWEDLHTFKELLLKTSLEEHLKLVRCAPTNLHVHAALANAYVMLSGLYLDPRKMEGYESDEWIPKSKYDEEMYQRFRIAAECAIEEFKILKEFAPNDPWIYTQLAYSYRDLNMPKEEMKAYEAIISLRPHDHDTLFKLGILYFKLGENALGLKVYQELKKAHFKKAEMLMNYYGIQ
ncbi:MAG: tetratricopeptide repeat protein [Parachlamydiaceae bacterium]